MRLTEFFSAELEREAAGTRRVLERVPEGRNDFKPHQKSMPLGYLASLVASMPGWITLMIERDELNLDDPASDGFRPRVAENSNELAAMLDSAVGSARRSLESTTDEH